MQTLIRSLLLCVLATGAVALSQDNPAKAAAPPSQNNPLSANNRMLYGG
ncbi:MAG TPA: hypothetical protein VF845_00470 [Terriglobales bacterium]